MDEETHQKRLQDLIEHAKASNADLQAEIEAIMREAQGEFKKHLLAQGEAELAKLRKKMQ